MAHTIGKSPIHCLLFLSLLSTFSISSLLTHLSVAPYQCLVGLSGSLLSAQSSRVRYTPSPSSSYLLTTLRTVRPRSHVYPRGLACPFAPVLMPAPFAPVFMLCVTCAHAHAGGTRALRHLRPCSCGWHSRPCFALFAPVRIRPLSIFWIAAASCYDSSPRALCLTLRRMLCCPVARRR